MGNKLVWHAISTIKNFIVTVYQIELSSNE